MVNLIANMIFPKTYNLSGTAHPEAVKSVASEPGGVPEEEPAVLQHFAASEQEKPLSIRSEYVTLLVYLSVQAKTMCDFLNLISSIPGSVRRSDF